MPKITQQGIAHLILLILIPILLIGLASGLVIVGHTQISKPKPILPAPSPKLTPAPKLTASPQVSPKINQINQAETSFTLALVNDQASEAGKIKVDLLVRSDEEAANLFAAKLNFPTNLLVLDQVEENHQGDYRLMWAEKYFNNDTGEISLVAGVPNPGLQTEVGKDNIRLARLIFNAKQNGTGVISFKDESVIYANKDNNNILKIKREIPINVTQKQ